LHTLITLGGLEIVTVFHLVVCHGNEQKCCPVAQKPQQLSQGSLLRLYSSFPQLRADTQTAQQTLLAKNTPTKTKTKNPQNQTKIPNKLEKQYFPKAELLICQESHFIASIRSSIIAD